MRRFVAFSVALGLESLFSTPLFAGINRWTPSNPPADVFAINVGPGPTGAVYASAGEKGVFRSLDYGDSWERITAEPVDQIAVDPGNPAVLYATRSLPQLGVYRSIDGGRTWQLANEGLRYPSIVLMLRAVARGHVYGLDLGFGGFYETTNQAVTWTPVTDGLFNGSAFAVDPTTNIHRLYVALYSTGAFGQVLWSDDGGRNWVPGADSAGYGHPKTDIAVDTSQPNRIYAGAICCNSFFRSLNFGQSWEHLSGPANEISSVVVDSAGTVFIGTGPGPCPSAGPCPPIPSGVFRSRDGGAIWETLNEGLDGRSIRRLLLLAGGRRLMALANPSGIFVYEFGLIAAVPDLSLTTRILTGFLLAIIGLLAMRAMPR